MCFWSSGLLKSDKLTVLCWHQKEPLTQAGCSKNCKRLLLPCKTEHCNACSQGKVAKLLSVNLISLYHSQWFTCIFLGLSWKWTSGKELSSYFIGTLKNTFHIITTCPLYWPFTEKSKWGSAAYCAKKGNTEIGCSVFSRQKAVFCGLGGLWLRGTDQAWKDRIPAQQLHWTWKTVLLIFSMNSCFCLSCALHWAQQLAVLALGVQIGVAPYLPAQKRDRNRFIFLLWNHAFSSVNV